MKTKSKPAKQPQTLSQCFLEHAARETAWARASAKECDYQHAAKCIVCRDVFLHCALIAQERKL